jgi:cell division protein FtsQ
VNVYCETYPLFGLSPIPVTILKLIIVIMSKSGTRRTTILNRRAGQQARMAFWMKRLGLGVLALVVVFGGAGYAVSSGYFDQMKGRMTRSFHNEMANSGFRVERVLVDGRVNTSRDALKYIVAIDKGQSIFEPDLSDIKDKLEHLVWVRSATVERYLPDTIAVKLEERVPLALWQHQGKLSVIDSDGKVLTDNELGRFNHLLILVGDDAPAHAADLVAMISAEKDLNERVESAKWIGGRRWDLYLKNGVSVRLPEDDLGQAVRRLADAQGEAKLMDRKIQSIDLRDPLRIVVQTEPGAAEEYQAAYHPQKNI